MIAQELKERKLELLRKEILCLQRNNPPTCEEQALIDLGPISKHLPDGQFPRAAVHEFLSPGLAEAAATTGFISHILSVLLRQNRYCLWLSLRRRVFPPALKAFGIAPEKVIFIELAREKEAFAVLEDALRCEALGAVVGEVNELDFLESRRLQLAVEQSRVTGFIHRLYPRKIQPTACVSRWKISPAGSQAPEGMPGLGFPRWEVELLKMRNGKPGHWQVERRGEALKAVARNEHFRLEELKKGIA